MKIDVRIVVSEWFENNYENKIFGNNRLLFVILKHPPSYGQCNYPLEDLRQNS